MMSMRRNTPRWSSKLTHAVWRGASFLRHPALIPALFLMLFFIVPIVQMLTYSFYQYHPTKLFVRHFTLENYQALISDPFLRAILFRTLRLSLLTTVCCAVLGYTISLRMREARGLEKMFLALVVLSPLMISPVILAYSWVVILAPNTGIVTRAFALFSLEAPRIMYTETGVLIGLVYANLVFMVLSLHAALENIDESLLRAGQIHGAHPMQVFLRITLPLSLPGLMSGSLIVFAISSSSFMMAYMLGGRQTQVLATYAYDMAAYLLNWPAAAAVSVILVLVTGILIYGYAAWMELIERRMGHVER